MSAVPPSNAESEKRVLGSVFWNADAINAVTEQLQGDDFFWEPHRSLFTAIRSLHSRRAAVDMDSVVDEMRRAGTLDTFGGLSALAAISEFGIEHGTVETNIKIVRRQSAHRRLIDAASKIMQLASKDGDDDRQSFADAQKLLLEADRGGDDDRDYTMARMTDEFYDDYATAKEEKGRAFQGISTGISPVDEVLLGMHPGEFIVVAGRASMGKTAFGLALAHNAAAQGKRALVFSLEMLPNELYQRIAASRTNVDSWKLRAGTTNAEEHTRIAADLDNAKRVPLTVVKAFGFDMARIRAKVLREKAKVGVDLVMIDYISMVKGGGQRDRHLEVGAISRQMKELALECQIPVIGLAQINRNTESRTDKRPMLSDLRESGSIEQDCDAALLLYRPWYYNKDADPYETQVIVAKHRNGPVGEAELDFDPSTSTFAARGCLPNAQPRVQQRLDSAA